MTIQPSAVWKLEEGLYDIKAYDPVNQSMVITDHGKDWNIDVSTPLRKAMLSKFALKHGLENSEDIVGYQVQVTKEPRLSLRSISFVAPPHQMPFGITKGELELARKAGITAALKYGDDEGSQLDRIRAGEIWNDHPAVQGAIEAIKLLRT